MAKLIKTKVFDKTTNNNDVADFVSCLNCGNTMLADIGVDDCPICNDNGLVWENKEQEVNVNSFAIDYKDDYILVEK